MADLHSLTAYELVAKHRLTEEELSLKATPKLFAHIIKYMDNWRKIRPHLGLNAVDQEDIEEKSEASQQRLFMLERWKEKFGREATFFKLVEVFFECSETRLSRKSL